IAILPVGLGAISSSRTRHLIAEILTRGAVLSEYPMRFPETPGNYSARNSILAGISLATVVIEAALDSGSLMTANFAVDANRFVFAVPGDITRKTSKGCNLLIKQGAKLVESADDIVDDLQSVVGKELRIQTGESKPADRVPASLNNLTPVEQRVYDIIFNSPTSFEELILIFGTEKMGELSTILLRLEMAGIIKQLPGKVYTSGK
ncbi:MAG: DNA-processing protein DprA, partial [Candidatus Sumerlaeia bacterium]|nr:DNA-processing protein DprA [Candidatus Sumerlaeia bacterium]